MRVGSFFPPSGAGTQAQANSFSGIWVVPVVFVLGTELVANPPLCQCAQPASPEASVLPIFLYLNLRPSKA